MQYEPQFISSYQSGRVSDKKPFLLIDNAFQDLFNAYVWRETVKKRDGLKLAGRLRRTLTSQSQTAADGSSSYEITDILSSFRTDEPNASLEKSTVVIRVDPGGGNETVFTDQGDGTFSRTSGTSYQITSGTYVNYNTGLIHIEWNSGDEPPNMTTINADFNYFPTLPAMGISLRELDTINFEQSIFFDTRYVYTYDDSNFNSPSATTWAGSNSDFFWTTNTRGSDPTDRLFFATNYSNPALSTDNRIRYTQNAATWTDFTPAVAGSQNTSENVGTLTSPWTSFNGTLTNTPIIPGSVTINVSNDGTDNDVRFKDTLTTYPNGTLQGFPSTNSGTINYSTGDISLTIDPAMTADAEVTATYQHETESLFQALIMLPYYGRLLAFNVYEGATAGTAVNYFNRLRFSQVGNPLERQAWVSTIFGRGGFIDAPTNEAIVSARFYKNTLIVFFERSTWELRYVGEYGLPFIWERISSDFGSESTFSTVLFDKGVLAVGDKAIVASSGNDVQRIDLEIPDTVFTFQNQEQGKKRVQSERDFQKELVFWSYTDPNSDGYDRVFPNRVLLYNYRNNTWADLRDNTTCFGVLQNASGVSWDLDISWDSDTSWDDLFQGEFPSIVSGNQQGFVHYYQSVMDPDPTEDSTSKFIEDESLFIKDITRSATASLSLEVPNHNLEQEEIIYITGLIFMDTSDSTVLTSTLNDRFYIIQSVTDADNFVVETWDETQQSYVATSGNQISFTPAAGTGTYLGGGVITLLPKMRILTKDFNPYQQRAAKMKSAFTDFQTDAMPGAEISVNLYIDSSFGDAANLPVFNTDISIAQKQVGGISGATQANPCVIESLNHGLLTGRQVSITNVKGMTALNGNLYTVTFIDTDHFSINTDSTGFDPYIRGGSWETRDINAPYVPGSNYGWNRFYSNVSGQYVTYELTYNDALMNREVTHQTGFELNAMILHTKLGGRFP